MAALGTADLRSLHDRLSGDVADVLSPRLASDSPGHAIDGKHRRPPSAARRPTPLLDLLQGFLIGGTDFRLLCPTAFQPDPCPALERAPQDFPIGEGRDLLQDSVSNGSGPQRPLALRSDFRIGSNQGTPLLFSPSLLSCFSLLLTLLVPEHVARDEPPIQRGAQRSQSHATDPVLQNQRGSPPKLLAVRDRKCSELSPRQSRAHFRDSLARWRSPRGSAPPPSSIARSPPALLPARTGRSAADCFDAQPVRGATGGLPARTLVVVSGADSLPAASAFRGRDQPLAAVVAQTLLAREISSAALLPPLRFHQRGQAAPSGWLASGAPSTRPLALWLASPHEPCGEGSPTGGIGVADLQLRDPSHQAGASSAALSCGMCPAAPPAAYRTSRNDGVVCRRRQPLPVPGPACSDPPAPRAGAPAAKGCGPVQKQALAGLFWSAALLILGLHLDSSVRPRFVTIKHVRRQWWRGIKNRLCAQRRMRRSEVLADHRNVSLPPFPLCG
eukprot:scaffold438_cov250-Pinguiococcus_pyrenoidosus.AAC.39